MKKSLSLLLAIAMVLSMFASVGLAAEAEAELDAQAKFEALKELGIFEGDANTGDAALDREMTRAEAAVIVAKLFELDIDNAPANPTFKDVAKDHWAYAYIEAAAKAGIINGRTNGEFDPGTTEEVAAGVGHVTLQELAVMLTLGVEYATDLTIDKNAKINGAVAWAQPYVAAAVEWGIIPSQSDYTHNALRAELVEAAYEVNVIVEQEALEVEGVEIVDAKNLDVTFNDGETVRVELEEALQPNVAKQVTFTYQGKEFTVSVTLEAVIAISSAKALSEKVIEVKLNEAAGGASASDFSVVTVDGVKTEDGSVIKVNSARLAAYDADNKTVYVETEGLEPGALYEIAAANGTKAQFVGAYRDKGTEPTFTARADGHNAVEIEFREPIEVDSKAEFKVNVYNSNRALEVSNVKVEQQKVVLSVEEMKSSELYEVIIEGTYKDLEGVAGTQKSYVFQGRDINDTKYQVYSAELVAEDVLVVQINNRDNRTVTDWDQVLNPENYVVEPYFGGDRIEVTEVVQTDRDNSKVALFLETKTNESELYTVTIQNMTTRNGFGIAEEPLNSAVFYGIPEDKTKLGLHFDKNIGDTVYFDGVPTKLRVTFNDLLDEEFATNKANYKLVNLSENEEVEIARVELSDNDVTKHTLGRVFLHLDKELKENDVYELTVSNLRDDAGNELGDDKSIVFTPEQAGGQYKTQAAIEKIEKSEYKYDNGIHKLTLYFNSHVNGDLAKDVTKYYIEGLGYPYNVADTQNEKVELHIPEPVQGEIYKVIAKDIVNRHNVAMKGDKVESKFAASAGISEGVKPSFVAARIVDQQTVALHFDANVKGDQFANFYDEDLFLLAEVYTYERGKASEKKDLRALNAKVFFDANQENVLYVRTNEKAFGNGYRFVSIEQSGFLHEDSAKEHAFAGVDMLPAAPTMLRVIAVDNKTITVTYNVPVQTPNPAHYTINDDIALEKVVKVSDYVYQFVLADGAELKTGLQKLSVLAENLVDITGYVQADENGKVISREFAGRTNAPGSIKDLTVIALDKYTFQVRFPEAMDTASVTNATYYAVYVQGTNTVVADGDDISAIIYDEETRTATVYANLDLGKDNRILDLKIAQEVTNALGTRAIDKDYKGRLVTRTNNPAAPKLSYKSAETGSDNYFEIVVELDTPLAAVALENVKVVKDSLISGSERTTTGVALSDDGLTLTIYGKHGGMEDYKYYAVVLEGTDANPLLHAHNGYEFEKEIVLEGTLVFKRN